ncbi:MAG: hypothetical protein FJZ95_05770 [Chloroflexi bacterium]|nr:hypothetical protein [Chloroflexota bacterium]
MKAYFMFTASGPLVALTNMDAITHPRALEKLAAKGITKFVANEIPVELAQARYGHHFDIVSQDLHETDDLRILDYNGQRAFTNFHFSELGKPIYYESEKIAAAAS